MRVDTTKILTTEEIKSVVAHLKSKRRYINNRQALIIFRLACCCGLRATEVCGLTVDDVRTEGKRPHIRVRKTVGKGGRARKVPLWWDQGTLDDLRAWRIEQVERGSRRRNLRPATDRQTDRQTDRSKHSYNITTHLATLH